MAASIHPADLVHHHVARALQIAAAGTHLDVDAWQLVCGIAGLLDVRKQPRDIAIPDLRVRAEQRAAREIRRVWVLVALEEPTERRPGCRPRRLPEQDAE